jgi:hypothetical protein
LRRPSIKKIRALFSKDSGKSEPAAGVDESKEILAAISKLPKFEPTYQVFGLGNLHFSIELIAR